MSVESEILRIQHNIANTYAAVAEKGGEVPLQPTSANLAAAVASIPSTGIQLESIEITEPPTKTKYVTGDTFDPTGMSVYATYSSGQTMYVDHASLIFDPSGPLEEGTTYVTVKFQWGPRIASASQAIEVVTALFSWWSPHMTSDTTPAPYVAIASSVFNNCFAYLAFRGGDSSIGGRDCWCDVSTGVGSYIRFDFGEKKEVYALRMMPSHRMTASYTEDFPKIFNVDGSNDGTTWDTLYSVSETYEYDPTKHEWRECTFESAKKYRYYRIITTGKNYSVANPYEVAIGQIEFFIHVEQFEGADSNV